MLTRVDPGPAVVVCNTCRHSRTSRDDATGMRGGGKLMEGDRKTPEGVYFLLGKATGGLDFDSFGNTAFPLNYPNPVDRIQGKTGDGIMIHGRGRSFGPRQTLGCVVLENDDVDTLDRLLRATDRLMIVTHGVPLGGWMSWRHVDTGELWAFRTWGDVPPAAEFYYCDGSSFGLPAGVLPLIAACDLLGVDAL